MTAKLLVMGVTTVFNAALIAQPLSGQLKRKGIIQSETGQFTPQEIQAPVDLYRGANHE
jgi:hypothetical protein